MKSMEGASSGRSGEQIPAKELYEQRERERENYFREMVRNHLLNTISDELEEAGFTDEEIDAFAKSLQALDDADADRVLAIPAELRPVLLKRIKDRLARGEESDAIIKDLNEKYRAYGFTAGYHLSPRQIPKIRKPDGTIDWTIRGTEFDDRDEMKMTYYSLDYLHRYKQRPTRYLYVVRAETGPDSSHKKDTSNNWGRAPLLPVVDEMDMSEIESKIDARVKENGRSTS